MSEEPGSPLPPEEEQPTLQSYTPAYTPEPIPTAAPPPKKKTNTWLIVAIVVLVVLCCCCLIGGVMAYNFGDAIMQGMGIY